MKLYDSVEAPLRTLGLLTLVCIAASGCGGSSADNPEEAMSLPESIGTWVLQEPHVTYDRETIFDYINGAGEVYRSYAFKDVLVAQYQEEGGGTLNVEIFDMGTPEDAYGVFSYARENEEDGLGGGYETRGSVLCFWQDRFYVCVAVEPGGDVPGVALVEVARGLSEGFPSAGERPELMGALPPDGLGPDTGRDVGGFDLTVFDGVVPTEVSPGSGHLGLAAVYGLGLLVAMRLVTKQSFKRPWLKLWIEEESGAARP